MIVGNTSMTGTQTLSSARKPDKSAELSQETKIIPIKKASTSNKTSKSSIQTTENKNVSYEPKDTKLNFKIHKGTGAVMIQVIDSDSGKIIREYPPESILDSIAEIWKNAGINVDKKA